MTFARGLFVFLLLFAGVAMADGPNGGGVASGVSSVSGTGAIFSSGGSAPIVSFNRAVPADANTILLYTLSQTSLPMVNTGSSGTTNNLTTSSGTPAQYGYPFGYASPALNLTNTANVNNASPSAAAQLAYPLTLSVWVNPTSTNTNQQIWQLSDLPVCTITRVALYWSAGATVTATLYIASVNHTITSTAPQAAVLGRWNHIGLTYDGATFLLYINGAQAATTSLTGAITYTGNNAIIAGGCSGTNFPGYLSGARLDNVARGPTWFANTFAQGVY